MTKEMILKPKPLSISSYGNYEKCPWKYWARRAEIEATIGDGLVLGKAVHEYIETGTLPALPNADLEAEAQIHCGAYDQHFNKDDYTGIGQEWKWGLDYEGRQVSFDSPDAIARGLIDFTAIKRQTVYVLDFKTSKSRLDWQLADKIPLNKQRLPKDLQLRWYLYALMTLIDDQEGPYAETQESGCTVAHMEQITFGHWYTRNHFGDDGKQLDHMLTGKIAIKNLRKHLPLILQEIRDAHKEVFDACGLGDFPPREHRLCEWCEYGPEKGSNKCPHWLGEKAKTLTVKPSTNGDNATMSEIDWTTTDKAQRDHVSIMIYGTPGSGKTTLAKTFKVKDDFRVLYLGVDPGQMALADRSFRLVRPKNGVWTPDFLNRIYEGLKAKPEIFDLVFIDGLDEVGEAVLAHEKANTKDPRQAYGAMGDFVASWTKAMRDLPIKWVVFTTHIEYAQENDGAVHYRPSFPGKATNAKVADWFDLVGCLTVFSGAEEGETGERRLQFEPALDDRYICKDRSSGLRNYQDPNMATVIGAVNAAISNSKKKG